jgi:hypothetical protein
MLPGSCDAEGYSWPHHGSHTSHAGNTQPRVLRRQDRTGEVLDGWPGRRPRIVRPENYVAMVTMFANQHAYKGKPDSGELELDGN